MAATLMSSSTARSRIPTYPTPDDLYDLRREVGCELQALRLAAGLSQKDLAKLLNVHQFTFISQIETGRRTLPTDKYAAYANALGIDPKEFALMLLRSYDPITYRMIFGGTAMTEVSHRHV